MTLRSTPRLDARYWVAILIASMAGANLGDMFAHDLGLGHLNGLLPLALVFAALLAVERWSGVTSEAFYWLIILTLRTAATNLGDLAVHDLKLPYPAVLVALAGLLAAVWYVDHARRRVPQAEEDRRLGGVDLSYWLAMLIAGTIGTAGGDYLAGLVGLGTACVVSLAGLGAILAGRISARLADRASYWVAIVAVRTAGTNLGDWFAGRHGLDIGVAAGAACFAVLLAGLLIAWPARPALRTQET